MPRHVERSAIVVMAKCGMSMHQIAAKLDRGPTTITLALEAPVDRRRRPVRSAGSPFGPGHLGRGFPCLPALA